MGLGDVQEAQNAHHRQKKVPSGPGTWAELVHDWAPLAYPVTHGFPVPSPLPPNLLQIGQRKHIHSRMHIRSCKDFSLFVSAFLVPIRGFRRIKEKVPCFSRSHQDTKVWDRKLLCCLQVYQLLWQKVVSPYRPHLSSQTIELTLLHHCNLRHTLRFF